MLLERQFKDSNGTNQNVLSSPGFVHHTIPKNQQTSAIAAIEPSVALGEWRTVDLLSVNLSNDQPGQLGIDTTVLPPWIMIPKDEPITLHPEMLNPYLEGEQRVNIFFYQTVGTEVSPLVHSAIWNGGIYTHNSGSFQVTGTSAGDDSVIKIGVAVPYVVEPVARLAVYERKILKVTVHPITLLNSTGQVLAPVENLPTAQLLQAKLDEVYLKQANIKCEVTISEGARVNWDLGVDSAGDKKGDGFFNFTIAESTNDWPDTLEERAVFTAVFDANAHVNVYFIATNITVASGMSQTSRIAPGSNLWKSSFVLGHAGKATDDDDNRGRLWVADYHRQDGNGDGILDSPEHWWAIAHEIGHYVGGLGHSNFTWSDGYNPNSDVETRLMTGREGNKRNSAPQRLIKPEWDKLHENFPKNP